MKYDEVYEYVGQMGTYQRCVMAAMIGFTLFALDAVTMIFVGAEMDHFCRVEALANLSYDRQKYIAIPAALSEQPDDPEEYSSCAMYALDYASYTPDELERWNRSEAVGENTTLADCKAWIYEQDTFVSTIVSRFDLVCGREFLNQFASMLYMVGAIIGGVVSGALSDRIGRRMAMMIFLLVKCVGCAASIFSPAYAGFATGRFILGVGSSACFITSYILLMEIVGPRYRSIAGCGMQIGTSVGFMLQPIIAMAVRNDVTYQLASMAPNVVIFTYLLVIPESPRWLIVVGRYKQADAVFRNMCFVNRTTLPDNFDVKNIEKDDGEQQNYFVLLKSPVMRLRTISMNIIWFFSGLIYFALALNTGYLSGDIYINTIISASLEVPAIVLCIFMLDWKRLGRRWSAAGSFAISAVILLLCIPMILSNQGMAVTVLNVVGKAVNVIAYSIIFVYASEIFPTEVRNIAMGVTQMFACFGSVAAPYVGEPMSRVWAPLPYVVMGAGSALTAALCLLLPETLGQQLCDTVEQAERLDRLKEIKSDSEISIESATTSGREEIEENICPNETITAGGTPAINGFSSTNIARYRHTGSSVASQLTNDHGPQAYSNGAATYDNALTLNADDCQTAF